MDTDFHRVIKDGETRNLPREIRIGCHVWIGCRCTILKGAVIPDHTIVAAGSLVTKQFARERVVIGGESAGVLAEDIDWKL